MFSGVVLVPEYVVHMFGINISSKKRNIGEWKEEIIRREENELPPP